MFQSTLFKGDRLAKIRILGGQGDLSDHIGDLNIKVFNEAVCATMDEPMGIHNAELFSILNFLPSEFIRKSISNKKQITKINKITIGLYLINL